MYKVASLLTLVGLLSACSPVASGDYVVYRISFAGGEGADLDAGCFGGEVPADLREDESDIRSAGTFGVYKAGDYYYLDDNTDVYEGIRDGKTFTFEGESVDRDYTGSETTSGFVETSREIKITLTVNGASVTGSVDTTTAQTCNGEFCAPEDTYTCEGEGTFVGSEIKDAELGYGWQDQD